jgi:hypothetical protein
MLSSLTHLSNKPTREGKFDPEIEIMVPAQRPSAAIAKWHPEF